MVDLTRALDLQAQVSRRSRLVLNLSFTILTYDDAPQRSSVARCPTIDKRPARGRPTKKRNYLRYSMRA